MKTIDEKWRSAIKQANEIIKELKAKGLEMDAAQKFLKQVEQYFKNGNHMEEKIKYKIEVSEKQLQILITATELAARISANQLFTIMPLIDEKSLPPDLYSEINETLYSLDSKLNGKMRRNEWSNIAWNLYEVFRHRLAWDKYPEGGYTVSFDTPRKISMEPLAKIEKIDKLNEKL